MIKKILCYFGWHSYYYGYEDRLSASNQHYTVDMMCCECCGKKKYLELKGLFK